MFGSVRSAGIRTVQHISQIYGQNFADPFSRCRIDRLLPMEKPSDSAFVKNRLCGNVDIDLGLAFVIGLSSPGCFQQLPPCL
jgi:hypothetical protein